MFNPLDLPIYISVTFLLVVLVVMFYLFWIIKSVNVPQSNWILLGMIFWVVLQSVVVINGVYATNLNTLPPKILIFGVLPTIFLMLFIFFSPQGNRFLDSISHVQTIPHFTLLHIVRLPIEMVLYWLAVAKKVPFLMTFDGRNFDILAGITAPFVVYLVFFAHKNPQKLRLNLLFWWNVFSMVLLGNIVFHAIFSAPAPFQMFGFEQPNIAILYFPIHLLPTFVVPMVIFIHFVVLRFIISQKR